MNEEDIVRAARVHVGGGEFEGPTSCGGVVNVTAAGQDALERAMAMLANIQGGLDKAVRSAMARAASQLRTNSAKAARERYDISAANIRDSENASISYSYQNGVQAVIRFAGQRIPLFRFGGASPKVPTQSTNQSFGVMIGTGAGGEGVWRYLRPSIPARGHVLKSTSPTQFSRAFVAKMPSGHIGIFERTGGMTSNQKDEIEELFGPSVPQMLGNEEVRERMAQDAMEKFEERLDHEVLRILNGWGSS